VIKLVHASEAWGTPDFEKTLKDEIHTIDTGLLPLQEGLSRSSHVSEGAISVVVLSAAETSEVIRVKTGIIYAGIIAGSCCADDPTPMSEQTEYCEVQIDINKVTAEAAVTIVKM